MAYRRPARWLAPLALAGAAVAVLLTVSSVHSGSSGSDASSTPATTHSATTTGGSTTSTTTTTSHRTHRYYVVKDGDVLSAIAASTGVPLATIEQLNPTVDAQSLHAGEKIKIAP